MPLKNAFFTPNLGVFRAPLEFYEITSFGSGSG
jgi:hypothetical protein